MKHGVRLCLQYGISRLEKDLERNDQRLASMKKNLTDSENTDDWIRIKAGISVAEQLSGRLRQSLLEAKEELARADDEQSAI